MRFEQESDWLIRDYFPKLTGSKIAARTSPIFGFKLNSIDYSFT
jgi:hypothetical protein